MHLNTCWFTQRDVRNPGLSGDQVTWSKDARQRQHEDNLCAWLSLDEVASYEEDARLKTEEPEEEDEKERDERGSGMSTVSINKLQVLWDHFIHAEPQSYEVLAQFPGSTLSLDSLLYLSFFSSLSFCEYSVI